MAREKLGQILIRLGYLDEQGLQAALEEQKRWGGQLGRYLVELGLISEEILIRALSSQYKVPAVALDPKRVDVASARMIPQEICERNNLVCFRADAQQRFLDVAMSDPTNLDAIDEVRVATKYNVRPCIAAPTAIDRTLSSVFYGGMSLGGELELEGRESLQQAAAAPGRGASAGQAGGAVGPPPMSVPGLQLDVTASGEAAPRERKASSPGGEVSLSPPASSDTGFHVTLDVPAMDKAALAEAGLKTQLAAVEAAVNRNTALLERLLGALAAKGLLTSAEVTQMVEASKKV